MLNPINSKLKKATKKISALDALVDGLKKFETEHVPKMAKDLTSGSSDIASRLERVQAEVAQLAHRIERQISPAVTSCRLLGDALHCRAEPFLEVSRHRRPHLVGEIRAERGRHRLAVHVYREIGWTAPVRKWAPTSSFL